MIQHLLLAAGQRRTRACLFCLLSGAFASPIAEALSIHISATPLVIDVHGSSTLKWTSKGAKSCWAIGSWRGSRALHGSRSTGRVAAKSWYGITCSDGKNKVTDGVTVSTRTVSVKLRAQPASVRAGHSASLSWSTEWARWCRAGGGWSGDKQLTGHVSTGALRSSRSYSLTCHRGNQTAYASVRVRVERVPVIRWRAPTHNVDGSRLHDLSGYWVYFGRKSRHYAHRAKITSADWTRYQPKSLPSGSYFVSVTAVDAQGNESAYSNEIRIRVP